MVNFNLDFYVFGKKKQGVGCLQAEIKIRKKFK